MALQGSRYYQMYIDTANSTQPTSVWTSNAVSGNYRYTEFIDQLIFDRLGKVQDQIKYYIDKLADKVDEDILNTLKCQNVLLDRPPDKKYLFDPKNLWSVPNDV